MELNQKEIHLMELNEEAIIYRDLDEAFVAIQEREDRFVAVYDVHKLLDIHIAQGLSDEEAHDHVYKNIVGAYLGVNTPLFIYMF